MYLLKNEDIDAALKFTGDVDGDIIRHVCNWILSHKQCFGKTILEVGCDIGLISCFLAKTFPESKIIAIDRFSEGVAIAKQLAEELELNNIEFKCIDANSINEKYDTVFSCRTLHENRDIKENYYTLFRGLRTTIQRDYCALCTCIISLGKRKGQFGNNREGR